MTQQNAKSVIVVSQRANGIELVFDEDMFRRYMLILNGVEGGLAWDEYHIGALGYAMKEFLVQVCQQILPPATAPLPNPAPPGCICPPGANKQCDNRICPRKAT